MVAVSVGHKYVGGTSGSGIVSSAADVLGMRSWWRWGGVMYV